MAYRPVLLLEVEALGATFKFGSADGPVARIASFMRSRAQEAADADADATATVQVNDLPPEVAEAMCELFVDGVRSWEGVEDPETGKPLPCDWETRKAIPSKDKLEVASAYLAKLGELEGNAPSGDAPPMPPGDEGGASVDG